MENLASETNCGESLDGAPVALIPAKQSASDVAAVVVSYDGCADLWPAFFSLFFRLWPDVPYPLYLISNHLTFPDMRVTALCVGDDFSWSETLSRGLELISSRFVLLMLDDFFLTAPVETALIERMHALMVANNAAYLRLVPNPKPNACCPENPEIGVIAKGAPYRASLQVAFWDRQLLLDLLRRGELAWSFELKGSRRSDAITEPFFSVCDGSTAILYRHVLQRGKLLPDAVRHFAPLGIAFDFSKRAVASEFRLYWQTSAVRLLLGRVWRFVMRRPL